MGFYVYISEHEGVAYGTPGMPNKPNKSDGFPDLQDSILKWETTMKTAKKYKFHKTYQKSTLKKVGTIVPVRDTSVRVKELHMLS